MSDEENEVPEVKVGAGGKRKREALGFDVDIDLFPGDWERKPGQTSVDIAIVSPTADEEIDASREGGGQTSVVLMARNSVRIVNGKTLDHGAFDHEAMWEAFGSKVRNVVVAIFMDLWGAPKEAVEATKATFRSFTIEV